jgi:hypothetical protein
MTKKIPAVIISGVMGIAKNKFVLKYFKASILRLSKVCTFGNISRS